MPVPQQQPTTNGLGIFQNLLKISGSSAEVAAAQTVMSEFMPIAQVITAAVKLLPEGQLKDWLSLNYIQFWTRIYHLIVGKKWTTGDYILGERLNDNVYCNGNIGRQQVPDKMVDLAHIVFNQLFGVRIATSDDLDALDYGFAAYRAREASRGISDQAINRAVFLKQRFYPSSTYNSKCWDLRYFEIYPLVGRIPDYEAGKWFNGDVLGGATAVDGLIPVSATDILDQYVGSKFDPNTGIVTTPDGTVINPGGSSGGGSALDDLVTRLKTADPILLLGGAAAIYFVATSED